MLWATWGLTVDMGATCWCIAPQHLVAPAELARRALLAQWGHERVRGMPPTPGGAELRIFSALPREALAATLRLLSGGVE